MAVCLLAVSAPASAGDGPRVVVELFTSQGDGMCVPADAQLAKLAERDDILALSLPVDVWDMLGWKDTLATAANSERQRAYVAAMGRGIVYTPQMIIDGSINVVGSRGAAVNAAVAAEIAARKACGGAAHRRKTGKDDGTCSVPCPVDVDIAGASQGRLRVTLHAASADCRKDQIEATVWLFFLRDKVSVAVSGGENAGRKLKYRNVVRSIKAVGVWHGEAASFLVDDDNAASDAVAVVVQQKRHGPVLGAAYFANAKRYARQ